jgi:hypothetical protein
VNIRLTHACRSHAGATESAPPPRRDLSPAPAKRVGLGPTAASISTNAPTRPARMAANASTARATFYASVHLAGLVKLAN